MGIKWKGPSLTIEKHSSICQYGDNSFAILTTIENREIMLSILSLNIGSNGKRPVIWFVGIKNLKEIIIDHEMISLQDRLLKSFHSANIFGDRMYIYGGKIDNKVSNELCYIDLSKQNFD